MKIKGWPRSIQDETFTSWLFRSAYYDSRIHLGSISEDYFRVVSRSFDPDFDFECLPFLEFCAECHLPAEILIKHFKPEMKLVVFPESRISYCAVCLREDIKKYGLPIWRKSWCYITSPFCLRHRKLLNISDDIYGFHKSWRAFSAKPTGADPEHLAVPNSNRWGGISSKVLDAANGIAMQKWLASLNRNAMFLLPSTSDSVDSYALQTTTEALLKIFLASRTKTRIPGVARSLFNVGAEPIMHYPFTYRESIDYGAGSASPYHRMMALLLVGYTLRLFTKVDLEIIKAAVYSSGYRWCKSVEGLGAASPWFQSAEEYVEIIGSFENLPSGIVERISPFLKGVEFVAFRSGVLSKDQMNKWKKSPLLQHGDY